MALALVVFIRCYVLHQNLHSFPTRRSSDLLDFLGLRIRIDLGYEAAIQEDASDAFLDGSFVDRKSTRLNSSHRCSSYAVFCLKKKKIKIKNVLELDQIVRSRREVLKTSVKQ